MVGLLILSKRFFREERQWNSLASPRRSSPVNSNLPCPRWRHLATLTATRPDVECPPMRSQRHLIPTEKLTLGTDFTVLNCSTCLRLFLRLFLRLCHCITHCITYCITLPREYSSSAGAQLRADLPTFTTLLVYTKCIPHPHFYHLNSSITLIYCPPDCDAVDPTNSAAAPCHSTTKDNNVNTDNNDNNAEEESRCKKQHLESESTVLESVELV